MPFAMRRSQQISYTQAQSSTFDKLPKLPKVPEIRICGSLRVFAFFFFFFLAGRFGRRKLADGVQKPILESKRSGLGHSLAALPRTSHGRVNKRLQM